MSNLRDKPKKEEHKSFKKIQTVILLFSVMINIFLVYQFKNNLDRCDRLRDFYNETVDSLKSEIHDYRMGYKK